MLHDVEYPEPLPLMLLLSTLWLHPAQLKFTLVVQYHVLHGSVSEVAQGDPELHVLVLVLLFPEHADHNDQLVHALSLQTHGV